MCVICRPGTVNTLAGELSKHKTMSVQMCLMFIHCGCVQKVNVLRVESQSRWDYLAEFRGLKSG